jgi:hypothetical protein
MMKGKPNTDFQRREAARGGGYLDGIPQGGFTRDTVTIPDLPSDFCDLTRDICRDKP